MSQVNSLATPAFWVAIAAQAAYGSRMVNVGIAIATMRETQDLTQRELARLAGVNSGYLSQVERGLVEPSARWLRAVTDALGKHLGGAA